MLAFVGEPALDQMVCHYDGDHTNNILENLRYGTAADNMADTKRHGRCVSTNKKRAVVAYTLSGDLAMEFESVVKAAQHCNVTHYTIRRWCDGISNGCRALGVVLRWKE
jgi:hypothetical protein